MRRWVIIVLLVSGPSAYAGSFIFGAPATRIDLAPTAVVDRAGVTSGTQLKLGIHWASLSRNHKTPVDVGFGLILESLAPELVPLQSLGSDENSVAPLYVERPDGVSGGYFEIAARVDGTRHRRAWLGTRLDLIHARYSEHTKSGFGLSGRAAWELFGGVSAAGSGGNAGGAIHGTFAVGVFVEAGIRKLPGEPSSMTSTAGLSGRLPSFVFGG